jgi:hypothetical protein
VEEVDIFGEKGISSLPLLPVELDVVEVVHSLNMLQLIPSLSYPSYMLSCSTNVSSRFGWLDGVVRFKVVEPLCCACSFDFFLRTK